MARALALVLALMIAANIGAAALVVEGSCDDCQAGDQGGAPCEPFCDCDDCLHCFRPLAFVSTPLPACGPAYDASASLLPSIEREPISAEPRELLVVPKA